MQQRSHRLRTTLVAFAALLLASSLCQAQFNTNSKTTTARPAPSYTPPPPPPRPEPAPRPTYNPPAERPAPAPSYNPAPRPAPSPSPAPSYTPAPRPAPAPNTYTPAARPAPATNTYTPAARPAPATTNTYTPRPAGGAAPATEAPRTGGATTYAPRTYTPGSPASNAARPAPTSNGATTYTPHTYTPSTSAAPARETSQPVVHTSNGVTTYTPHASGAPASPSTGGASSYSVRSPAVSGSAGAPAGSSFNGAAARPVTNTPAAARPIYSVAGGSVAVKSPTGAATLTTVGSHQVIQQLNAGRSEMSGINKRAIPPGKATVEPNGHVGIVVAPGRSFDLRPNGSLASLKRPGLTASFRGDGHIAVLRTPALEVAHGPHGERLIVARRPDHTVVVSTGPHAGYVQRTVTRNGVSYIQRTYATRQYGPHAAFVEYRYHGVALDHYVPRYTYAPAFYGWAYYGWDRPTPYAWGWDGQPWLGYYGGYFSPTQAYLSGALWLTDFYLGQTLAAGYQQENADAAPDDGQGYDSEEAQADDPYAPADTPITPEVKQAIADEVQQQFAYENAAAAQPDQAPNLTDLPQVLQPNHIFVVDEPRSVLTADQQTCSLSAGNVIQLAAAPGPDDAAATLTVVSSRRADCPAGVQVTIALDDLQEMQNNFRAQLDAGLKTLHDQQGQGGLPAAPLSAISPPPRPGPDLPDDGTDVQAALTAAQRQASQAELNVAQTAFAPQP